MKWPVVLRSWFSALSGERPQSEPQGGPRRSLDNEFGWRTHEAVQAWTSSVDAKASIVLIVETALAAAAGQALITANGELHQATGLHLAVAIVAVALLGAAVACALWVVFPRLEHRRTTRLAPTGLLFFGHLRARSPDEIAAALARLTLAEERSQLAAQLQITSKVAWRKHVWLQRSLILLALGAAVLAFSFVGFADAGDSNRDKNPESNSLLVARSSFS